MKLVLCRRCSDVVKLGKDPAHPSHCFCRAVGGYYLEDGLNAKYYGDAFAIPLGFSNPSLILAIQGQPESGWGKNFEAFVIAKDCPTMRMVEHPIIEKRKKRVRTRKAKL